MHSRITYIETLRRRCDGSRSHRSWMAPLCATNLWQGLDWNLTGANFVFARLYRLPQLLLLLPGGFLGHSDQCFSGYLLTALRSSSILDPFLWDLLHFHKFFGWHNDSLSSHFLLRAVESLGIRFLRHYFTSSLIASGHWAHTDIACGPNPVKWPELLHASHSLHGYLSWFIRWRATVIAIVWRW